MHLLSQIGLLLLTLSIGLSIYYWSAVFKKMGELSTEEINEEETADEVIVNDSEVQTINYVGKILFVLIGFFVWAYIGTTVGKIASDLTNHQLLKWISYFLMYFMFLRLPFGIGNRLVKDSFDFEQFPEKVTFVITMVVFYIIAIADFDMIPTLFKWHLSYLN